MKVNSRVWQIFYDSLITYGGYKDVLLGLKNTMLIAVFGLAIGIVIGTIIAISKVIPQYKPIVRIWSKINSAYVSLFRGTPILVQLLVINFVLFPALNIQGVDKLLIAIVAFGLNSGAYVSEIMRAGIQSVDKGQLEAGRSLGMSYVRTMWNIVIPQAIKNILPTLGNEFISLIKETSVVSFIAVVDITKAFKSIADSTYQYIIPYLALALVYLVIVILFSMLVKAMERRLCKSDKRN
ncbi:MAG: amino acid ABC transporter permease [Clostridia bacterium]